MHDRRSKLAVVLLAGMAALGLVALAWTLGLGSSEAQEGSMHNCPQPGKWAISVWSGDDGTDVEQAVDTCGVQAPATAYYIDPDTQVWLRWFAGRPAVSNLTTVDDMQGVVALGSAIPTLPTATPTSTATLLPMPGTCSSILLVVFRRSSYV